MVPDFSKAKLQETKDTTIKTFFGMKFGGPLLLWTLIMMVEIKKPDKEDAEKTANRLGRQNSISVTNFSVNHKYIFNDIITVRS